MRARTTLPSIGFPWPVGVWLISVVTECAHAQALDTRRQNDSAPAAAAAVETGRALGDPADVLSADEWQQVDAAVGRALEWLAAQQEPDGSFPTLDLGQPGVTSLCVMAFLQHGHVPGEGRYGSGLERAIDYVIRCQKQNGLVSLLGPDEPALNANHAARDR
jgi:hypothetical protein